MPDDERAEAEAGFYEKLGILSLQTPLDAIKRGDYYIERLEKEWRELFPDERREIWRGAMAAYDTSESWARSIAEYRGKLWVLEE